MRAAEQAHRKAAEAHRADRNAQLAADQAADEWDGDSVDGGLEAAALAAEADDTNRKAQHASRVADGLYPLDECAKTAVSLAANEEGEPFSAAMADLAAKEHDRLAAMAAKMPEPAAEGEFDDDRR